MNKLLIYPEGGLGNRLNCIYSGIYWQKKLGIEMKILWEVNYACCINFDKLFKQLPKIKTEVKTVYTLPLRDRMSFRSMKGKLYIERFKRKSPILSSEDTCRLFSGGGEAAIEEMISNSPKHYIKSWGIFADWEHISEVVDCLKPAIEIGNKVNDIMSPYMNSSIIGVHIRRTDHKWAIQNSPLYLFTDQMEQILKEEPNTYFYLATDDADVESQLSAKFPLIEHKYFSNEKSRKTEAGMKDAYVDMLYLSRCEKIYGSYQSTFSNMAAVIGRKECIVLYNHMEKQSY